MTTAIYTITSPLHNPHEVEVSTREFLDALNVPHTLRDNDYSDYGTHALDLIYVRTGGTEGVFQQLLPQLRERSSRPVYLLASDKANSLPASMEILSFLRQQGIAGEILHGSRDYVAHRIAMLARVGEALRHLRGNRLGIIGAPSDWLISSRPAPVPVKRALGLTLVDIDMAELVAEIEATPEQAVPDLEHAAPTPDVARSMPMADRIYRALAALVERHDLQGLTLRCFDLLTAVRNTGCLALARLNARGIVAGCEGDVPAMLTMAIARALTGSTGFQANPARIDPTTGEVLFAHCTIPLDMVDRYEFDTHFESGIGVGIRGYMAPGPVTVFKVSADLTRHFVAEGRLERCQGEPNLCRTQQVITLDNPEQARYFLTNPIGNHHIIVKGHHAEALNALMARD